MDKKSVLLVSVTHLLHVECPLRDKKIKRSIPGREIHYKMLLGVDHQSRQKVKRT